jgi:hypothetical protein
MKNRIIKGSSGSGRVKLHFALTMSSLDQAFFHKFRPGAFKQEKELHLPHG